MAHHRVVVVTATTDAERFATFATELNKVALARVPIVAVYQKATDALQMRDGLVDSTKDYLGVVPAFARGCKLALRAYPQAEVIACLHDDTLLYERNWDQQLLDHFHRHANCGLAGFGGAWGLGDEQAGQGQYRPTWLVRRGFMSNMAGAENHGTRVLEPRRIAVLDGFSLVFRRPFLEARLSPVAIQSARHAYTMNLYPGNGTLFKLLQDWGVVHHAYDAAMGAFAKDLGWDTWLLPFECAHLGGQTAVGDAGYNEWAKVQRPGFPTLPSGDEVFWQEAHGIVWKRLGHLLPFVVEPRG